MKRLAIVLLCMVCAAHAMALSIREIVRTNDVLQTRMLDAISWYSGESITYDCYLFRGTNRLAVTSNSSVSVYWQVTDASLTNYYIYKSGSIVSGTGGHIRVELFPWESGLDYTLSPYESALVMYEASGGSNRYVGTADRTQVTVYWNPDYSGAWVSSIGTNTLADLRAADMALSNSIAAITQGTAKITADPSCVITQILTNAGVIELYGAEADPVWAAQKAGYATGTPLYAYTETDPIWNAVKGNYLTSYTRSTIVGGTNTVVETNVVGDVHTFKVHAATGGDTSALESNLAAVAALASNSMQSSGGSLTGNVGGTTLQLAGAGTSSNSLIAPAFWSTGSLYIGSGLYPDTSDATGREQHVVIEAADRVAGEGNDVIFRAGDANWGAGSTNAARGGDFEFEVGNFVDYRSSGVFRVVARDTNYFQVSSTGIQAVAEIVPLAGIRGYQSAADAAATYVDKSGDSMTGALNINMTGGVLRIDTTNSGVAIGRGIPYQAFNGVAIGDAANGADGGVAIGANARGDAGVGIGSAANGYYNATAVGFSANAYNGGAGAGKSATAVEYGSAFGYNANALYYGAALGYGANGSWMGASVGSTARGGYAGVAIGWNTAATNSGVAIGYGANGANTNIAIGVLSAANPGRERIAIGNRVTNTVDQSVVVGGPGAVWLAAGACTGAGLVGASWWATTTTNGYAFFWHDNGALNTSLNPSLGGHP